VFLLTAIPEVKAARLTVFILILILKYLKAILLSFLSKKQTGFPLSSKILLTYLISITPPEPYCKRFLKFFPKKVSFFPGKSPGLP